MINILAFTGHRPEKLGGYAPHALDNLTFLAESCIKLEAPSLVVSGMALGWDTAVALAALNLRVPLLAAIPFDGQERRWPDLAQQRYRSLLKQANKVHVVSPGVYAAWKMHVRNEWMVRNSDKLIALWDGSSGGTSSCVQFAEKKQKKHPEYLITNVWHLWND